MKKVETQGTVARSPQGHYCQLKEDHRVHGETEDLEEDVTNSKKLERDEKTVRTAVKECLGLLGVQDEPPRLWSAGSHTSLWMP